MHATDLRNSDDFPTPGQHDRARVRTILVECKMRAAAVVVVHIRREDATEMTFVADYYVVEALAAKRTDHAFDICILPRRSRRADHPGDSHRIDLLAKVQALRGIAIAQQIARSSIPWKRFGYLSR